MTVPTDFIYRVVVVQFAPTDGPDYVWGNTWEISSEAGLIGDEEAARRVANAFAAYHRSLLLPGYGVDRVILSTYGPDLPFPEGFATYPYRLRGTSNAGGTPLPLTNVAFIRKNVSRGRDGKLFLRGVLTSNSIAGEEFDTTRGVNFPSAHSQAAAALFNALNNANVRIVVARGPVAAIQSRDVLSLEAVNARSLQYRTRRKTRFQQNALSTLGQAFQDGSISPGEIPAILDALRRLFPGTSWPELPPPGV